MSQCSNMSVMSVSYNGEEVSLETALDDVFQKLQMTLNSMQCSVRTLAMLTDQDADFQEAVKYGDEIEDFIDNMFWLFKDLKNVNSQIMLHPDTPEEKEFLKAHKVARKIKKNAEIAERKAADAKYR